MNSINTPSHGPIGLFDSGFGGLSIFREMRKLLPEDYDYIFLGDNGRAPYGNRSFEEVYTFTYEAVRRLFQMGCPLVILACNTASAKALRNIQQHRLPALDDPTRRVLGVIRPTVEAVGAETRNKHIGIVATRGTILSNSYTLELAKILPNASVSGQACPQWVPLIEQGMLDTPELLTTVKNDLQRLLEADPLIDTVILGCTHYPLISDTIRTALNHLERSDIRLIEQGPLVAKSLASYLQRHPEMEQRITRGGKTRYYTTGSLQNFDHLASLFLGERDGDIHAQKIRLEL